MSSPSTSRSSKLALSAVAGIVERASGEYGNSNCGTDEGHKPKLNHACGHFEIDLNFDV